MCAYTKELILIGGPPGIQPVAINRNGGNCENQESEDVAMLGADFRVFKTGAADNSVGEENDTIAVDTAIHRMRDLRMGNFTK